MKQRSIGLISVVLGMMILAPSAMAGTLVEFEGGIGVITDSASTADVTATSTTPPPATQTGGLVVRNVVRGVSPGGAPWVIRRFEAKIKENGDIRAEGRGLVLAGTNNIGTSGGVPTVLATLICQDGTTFNNHDSASFPLAADGDFKIQGPLTPSPPDPCTNPVLLIRIGGQPPITNAGNRWLAAGIPKLEHDD